MRRAAFTLIELLVVIAVLAVLTGLTLAALGSAREKSDAAQCVSNLRQLVAANVAYAIDHEGRYVAAQEPTNTIRWHGVRTSTDDKFDPTRGPLAPYLGAEGRIKFCPAFRRALTGADTFEEGTGGYGYNACYVGGTYLDRWRGEVAAALARPAETVMFSDAAYARENGLQEYAYTEPWRWVDRAGRLRGRLDATTHFRHAGRAHVAWCDGRVSAENYSRLDGKNVFGGDGEKHRLGWFGPEEQNGFWNPRRER